MSFLTISDGTTTLVIDVEADTANQTEPDRIGSTDRVFDGTYRSSVAAQFRNFTFPVPQITQAFFEQVYELTKCDRKRTIGGDAMGSGGAITGIVRITAGPFNDDVALGGYFTRSATLSVSEG